MYQLGRLETEGRISRKVGTAASIESIKVGETSDIKQCSLSLRRAEGMIDHKVGTDTDIELRQGLKVGEFSDAKQYFFFSSTVDIKLMKGFKVDEFTDTERCLLSLERENTT